MPSIADLAGVVVMGTLLGGATAAYRFSPPPEAAPFVRSFYNPIFEYSTSASRLIDAIQYGRVSTAQRLLSLDPELAHYRFGDNGTALHMAAATDQAEIVQILLDRGAAIESRGIWGGTPLHCAAWLGNRRTVALLLSRGADTDARCVQYEGTPLLWAAHGSVSQRSQNPAGRWLEVAQMLVTAGAKADTRNAQNQTAESLASPEVAAYLHERAAEETGVGLQGAGPRI